jgi:hypothetical protein
VGSLLAVEHDKPVEMCWDPAAPGDSLVAVEPDKPVAGNRLPREMAGGLEGTCSSTYPVSEEV